MQSKDNTKDTSALFNEFEGVETHQWQSAIEKFLKGKSIETLDIHLEEGIRISPVVRAEADYFDRTSVSTNFPSNWLMCTYFEIDEKKSLDRVNKLILDALSRGANSLSLAINKQLTVSELTQLFQGVELAYIQVHFQLNLDDEQQQKCLQNLGQLYQVHAAQLSFGYRNNADNYTILYTCQPLFSASRNLTIILSDSSTKSMAQALYQLSKQIDFLLAKGLAIETILRQVRFEYPAGIDYFGTIAGMRAIRILWNGLLNAYKSSEKIACFLHVNVWMNATSDPYQNMIKASTQTMSAAVAGANSIYVEPSKGIEKADAFSRRIALNIQHILQSESYLNKIADPAAGAYYIENITQKIADKAWQQFCKL